MSKHTQALLVFVLLSALVWIPIWGCSDEDESLPYAPLDCERHKPDLGHLNIQLSINGENLQVPVTVYRGDMEEGIIVEEDDVAVRTFSYMLPVDKEYAVTALYLDGPDTVLVISSGRISTSSTEYRDTDCWEVNDGEVDVRLKP